MKPTTELWCFGNGFNPVWVAFGAHLSLDEVVDRHSEEYFKYTKKKITGTKFSYATDHFNDDFDDIPEDENENKHFYLCEQEIKNKTTPVTIILSDNKDVIKNDRLH